MKWLSLPAVLIVLSGCSIGPGKNQIANKKIGQADLSSLLCKDKNLSPGQIFNKASNSIAVILSQQSQGSGFIVKQDDRYTYILTDSRVVNDADKVQIAWKDGRT